LCAALEGFELHHDAVGQRFYLLVLEDVAALYVDVALALDLSCEDKPSIGEVDGPAVLEGDHIGGFHEPSHLLVAQIWLDALYSFEVVPAVGEQ
jgi:hypothetical protein